MLNRGDEHPADFPAAAPAWPLSPPTTYLSRSNPAEHIRGISLAASFLLPWRSLATGSGL
jgi:hypothetical protein